MLNKPNYTVLIIPIVIFVFFIGVFCMFLFDINKDDKNGKICIIEQDWYDKQDYSKNGITIEQVHEQCENNFHTMFNMGWVVIATMIIMPILFAIKYWKHNEMGLRILKQQNNRCKKCDIRLNIEDEAEEIFLHNNQILCGRCFEIEERKQHGK